MRKRQRQNRETLRAIGRQGKSLSADPLKRRRDPGHAGRACIVTMFAVATLQAPPKHRQARSRAVANDQSAKSFLPARSKQHVASLIGRGVVHSCRPYSRTSSKHTSEQCIECRSLQMYNCPVSSHSPRKLGSMSRNDLQHLSQ